MLIGAFVLLASLLALDDECLDAVSLANQARHPARSTPVRLPLLDHAVRWYSLRSELGILPLPPGNPIVQTVSIGTWRTQVEYAYMCRACPGFSPDPHTCQDVLVQVRFRCKLIISSSCGKN